MKNQKGVSMITLIITIIVIIILAAIAFIGLNATDRASYSGFSQEFSDFALNFKQGPLGDVQLKYGTMGKSLTNSQAIYLAATATDALPENTIIPAGVEFVTQLGTITSAKNTKNADVDTARLGKLFNEAGTDVTNQYWGAVADTAGFAANLDKACWELKPEEVEGYTADHEFYGDNLGTEDHFVTQDGFVFTLPGFPRTVDEEVRMYIAPDVYYVVDANYANVINASETTAVPAHVSEQVAP